MVQFELHPVAGFALSATNLAVGCIASLQKIILYFIFFPLHILHIHQPPIVAELLQDLAWIGAILAAAFTCYGVYKTHHKRKSNGRSAKKH